MVRYRYVVATVVLVLCWGSTFAAVKIGLRDCSPMVFAGLRSLLAGALIAAFALAGGGRPELRARAVTYALLTLFNVVGFLGLQSLAIQHLPSGISAVLIYLQPVLTAVLAVPLLGERVGVLAGIGLVVAFAGIVVVSTGAMSGHVSASGIGYALGCAAAWSLGTIVFKRQSGGLDARWAVAVPSLAGGLVLSAFGYGTEDVRVHWSGRFVGALAFTVVLGTALAWLLWFALVAAQGSARAAANIFFVPLVAVVVGVIGLGEQLRATLVAGAALVVLGVYLVNRPAGTASEQSG